jgi:hypothetical protein
LGDGDAGLGDRNCRRLRDAALASAPWVKIAVPSKPPSRTSRLLPRPTSSSGSSWRTVPRKCGQVVEVGGKEGARHRAAGTPRHMRCHGFVGFDRAA